MIQSIELSRGADKNVYYNITCCKIQDACNQHIEFNYFDVDDKDGKTIYFDDQKELNCSCDDFITDLRLNRNSTSKKIRYTYKCCNTPYRTNSSYLANTTTSFGRSNKIALISCKHGYGLTKIHLYQRDSLSEKIFKFACTKQGKIQY